MPMMDKTRVTPASLPCRNWLVWPMVLCVLLACSVASAQEPGEPVDPDPKPSLSELFAQEDPSKATKQQKMVLDTCLGNIDRLTGLITGDTAFDDFKPGWQKKALKFTCLGKAYNVDVHFRIPRGYTVKKSWPVLLLAHGQGSDGKSIGRMFERMLGNKAGDFILLAPTLPPGKGLTGQPHEQQTYLAALNWAGRNLNIDDDRVCISGYSQGGHVSWQLALMHGYRFAASVPMAGIPMSEGGPDVAMIFLDNLSMMPIWALWGEKDRAAKDGRGNVDFSREADRRLKKLGCLLYKGTEVPGAGHGQVWPVDSSELVKFFTSNRRTLMPKSYVHMFSSPFNSRGYYVEAVKLTKKPLDFTKRITIKLPPGRGKPTKEQILQAHRKHIISRLFKLSVTLDSARNRLSIIPGGISSVRIRIYKDMFNPDKTVNIRFHMRSWTGKIPISPECILQNYIATRDATAIVVNELGINSFGKVVFAFNKLPLPDR